jgi:hypothetical protein
MVVGHAVFCPMSCVPCSTVAVILQLTERCKDDEQQGDEVSTLGTKSWDLQIDVFTRPGSERFDLKLRLTLVAVNGGRGAEMMTTYELDAMMFAGKILVVGALSGREALHLCTSPYQAFCSSKLVHARSRP